MHPSRSSAAALADALSPLLPTAEQTQLLRACLHRGQAGRQAWAAWRSTVNDPTSAEGPGAPDAHGRLPLLAAAQHENELVVHPELLTTLRTATLHAELRSETFFRICQEVLQTLAEAGLDPIVLRGAALAATTYPEPALRHCHDLDLLIPAVDQDRAAAALTAAGLMPGGAPTAAGSRSFYHLSGLPIMLHSQLFALGYANVEQAAIVARAERPEGLKPAAVLAPADALLHLLGHAAFSPKRERSFWAIDAWQVLTHRPNLDWRRLIDTARANRLALPAFTLLRYLATELAAPIPATVFTELAAARPDTLEREGALYGAQTAANWSYGRFLHQASGWRARSQVLQWMLLPSPAYLGYVSGVRCSPMLPLYYVGRLLRQAAREAAKQRRRLRSWLPANQPAAATAPAPRARE